MNDEHDNAMTDIDMLKRLTKPAPATPKQLSFFWDLVKTRQIDDMIEAMPDSWLSLMNNIAHDIHDKGTSEVYTSCKYAKADLSKFIDQLLKQPMKPEEPIRNGPGGIQVQAIEPQRQHLEDGMYRHPNGTIYKVYHTVHGSNVQVAKRLAVINEPPIADVVLTHDDQVYELKNRPSKPTTVKFVYEGRKPLYSLTPDMRLTIEQAREFGALYGTCCICGRTLTNELSIHLGIGPVCGRREFGGEFEFMINEAKLELPKNCICPGSPLPYCPVHGSEDYDQGEAY